MTVTNSPRLSQFSNQKPQPEENSADYSKVKSIEPLISQKNEGPAEEPKERFTWERFNQTLQHQPNVTELLSLLYSDAQSNSTIHDQEMAHRRELLSRQSVVSPSEAVHLLSKYHQAVELIKKHKQHQQQATVALMTVLQQYLA